MSEMVFDQVKDPEEVGSLFQTFYLSARLVCSRQLETARDEGEVAKRTVFAN